MKILITGQCTVHKGRLENGNIGNYYISETAFRELHRVFPNATLVTTFQFSDEFCQREKVYSLPMEYFYQWADDDLHKAIAEYGTAELYYKSGCLYEETGYIKEVMSSDLVIDFSGEMWGDHAEPVGKNRFLVGLLKIRTAQLLGVKTVLLASSEGPFSDDNVKSFAQLVYKNFDLVSNREPASKVLLQQNGFDVSRTHSFACPAFLFEPETPDNSRAIIEKDGLFSLSRPNVGYILCGFNFAEGPYDKQNRIDEEFIVFAESIEYIVNNLGAHVLLLSHQNGFEKNPFKLINGRDFPIIKRLYEVVEKRGKINMQYLTCPQKPYNPWQTKGIISQLDMLVTGRVHGFVAGVSSFVPTVLIQRGFGPVSHRNIGFAQSAGLEDYIAQPKDSNDMKLKIKKCYEQREYLRKVLEEKIPNVKQKAQEGFDILRKLF